MLTTKGAIVCPLSRAMCMMMRAHAHERFASEAGHALPRTHPAIAAVMAGIARANARPIRRAAPLAIEHLRRIVAGMDGKDLRSLRDRALLLVGFFGALRRSELVALDVAGGNAAVADNVAGRSLVEIGTQGLVLHLTGTKASAATQTVALPRRGDELCAAAALERYIAAADITNGPLFCAISKADRLLGRRLEAGSVRHILRERSGISAFSPHSLRAGFITSAANAKAPEHLIQRISRHKSVAVLRSYIRDADAFATSAAAYL
jgi:site-specific recombinase XerD